MNAGLSDDHASIRYYDSDYPGRETTPIPENFDPITERQGLAHDVAFFVRRAHETGGPVLELCCGTGRVAIPLARAGFEVAAVDLSQAMLDRLRTKLEAEPRDVASRVTPHRHDVTRLDLGRRFPLVVAPFNSLMCIPDARLQLEVLRRAAAHLAPRGTVVLDLVNPLLLPMAGDLVPKPFFTRRAVDSGRTYTRFAALGAVGTDQVQELFGWYDEIAPDGTVRRAPYSMAWRLLFPFELELMLEAAGLAVVSVHGGHRDEPFTPGSPKMIVTARAR
jgi:SAM-dependent methyltransferase